MRLINGFAPYAGQVAVYRRGTWVAVCDDGWDEKDATVVCRELGYPGVTIVTKEMFFGVPGRIKIEQLGCYGNETKLSECSFKTTRKMSQCLNRNRRHREAGVICEVGNHTDPRDIPKIRLTGPPYREGAGNVEVYINRHWGRVCDSGWSYYEAKVVCRQLGYSDAERSTCCGWYFGAGSGPPLMAYATCKGNETTLFHCPHVGAMKGFGCGIRDTAGVICKLRKPYVRLVGSLLPNAGFVQIRHQGRWGSFCDWDWGLIQGHVVCRELGFSRAIYTTIGGIFDKQSDWPIWIEETKCIGNESSIFKCELTYIRNIRRQSDICNHRHSAGVICESNKETGLNESAAVRLQGSNMTHMGRVEIKQEGFWHDVCSIGWEKQDADVVCRQLGYPEAVLEIAHGQFGYTSGPRWLTSVHCQGNETSLDQCVSAGWRLEPTCKYWFGAGVVCKMHNITGDGEVRLRGSTDANAGRVEVQIGGIWGTVSDIGWDLRSGHVVCRQLGYVKAVQVFTHSRYGKGNINLWLSSLECNGQERNLLDCRRGLTDFNYDIVTYNAGVECTNHTNYTSEVEVRLFGMDRPNYGRVQIKYNGTWGTICAGRSSLTFHTAEVICRQLGQGPPAKHNFVHNECTAANEGAEIVWLSDLSCRGFESSVDQCPHRGWGIMDPFICLGCTPKYCSTCLICRTQNTSIAGLQLRLVGSSFPYAGRVEVNYAGIWGVICLWRMTAAVYQVICRHLGHEGTMGDPSLYESKEYRYYTWYGDSYGPVWLSEISCHGNESNLSQCKVDNPVDVLCSYANGVLEVMCRPRNYTAPYPIRLVGSPVPSAGRLEIQINGTWGSVCSYGVSGRHYTSMIACRQLGFGVPLRESESSYSPLDSECPSNETGSGPIWLINPRCTGNESSLDQCPKAERSSHLQAMCADHTSDVCLVCNNSQYQNSEIAVELRGSDVSYAGQVKVRYQGVWGTLCGIDWKTETATVICRQLGFKGVELDFLVHNRYSYGATIIYDANPGPVWFNGGGCSGHERTLGECQLWQEKHCGLSDEVAIICQEEDISVNEFPVRLGGKKSNEGLVEVFYGGLWGSVRAENWDLKDALVFCRQLGFHQVQSTYQKTTELRKQVFWFGDFDCKGSELTLGSCKHRLIAQAVWGYKKPLSVFVYCGNGTVESSQTPSLTTTLSQARITPSATSSERMALRTKMILPTSTASNIPHTSAPTTQAPLCPTEECQNGGSCEEMKCVCSELYAGIYCQIYVGDDSISLVIKMRLNQWNSMEFRRAIAHTLTEYCRTRACLQERNTNIGNQKKVIAFRTDDIIILQGYPKIWQDTDLLNVKLAIKMPKDSANGVISRDTLSHLLVNVATALQGQIGHNITYIGYTEITSVPLHDSAGRKSAEKPPSMILHKSVVIALGIAVGVVLLVAVVVAVWYRRRKNSEKAVLRGKPPEDEENIRLVDL